MITTVLVAWHSVFLKNLLYYSLPGMCLFAELSREIKKRRNVVINKWLYQDIYGINLNSTAWFGIFFFCLVFFYHCDNFLFCTVRQKNVVTHHLVKSPAVFCLCFSNIDSVFKEWCKWKVFRLQIFTSSLMWNIAGRSHSRGVTCLRSVTPRGVPE